MSAGRGGSRSRSAAAWRGMSRRNTSQPRGSTDRAMAAAHDTKTPRTGIAVANTTSSSSFPREKTALPTGTQKALRSPVSTPSWRVSSAQATHEAVKTSPAVTPLSGAYEGPQRSSVSRKTTQATHTTAELTAYARRTSDPVVRPARGT